MLTLNLNLLYTVVNVLILFLLLRKFLYKPVMGIIAQRQKQVDDALNAAETSKKEAAAAMNAAQLVLRGVQSCRSLFFGGLSGSQSVVYLLLALRNDVHDRLVQELAEQQKQHQNVDDCIQKVQIQCQHSSCLRDQPRNRMMIRATTKPKIAVPSARAAPSSRLV